MKLLYGLVVDGYGHLRVGVEGELYVVAGPVFHRRLVPRQLQVLAAPARRRREKVEGECSLRREQKSEQDPNSSV